MSDRYQDYVIRDGRYIGAFEEMYQQSRETPWHQDETANAIFSDFAVAILKRRPIASLLDVGCGLGYMTERLRRELPAVEQVSGIDVSETAVNRAARMFPQIAFRAGTIHDLPAAERFDAVVSKDVLWYVLDALPRYLRALAAHSNRWVYIGQSFPESRPFYGEDVLPDAAALFRLVSELGFPVVYSAVDRDAFYGGREYAHALVEVVR